MGSALLILVTNDDGIAAAGIKSLANSLKRIGDVAVVAPKGKKCGGACHHHA